MSDLTLEQAKHDLWDAVQDGGMHTCPCCGQGAKIYARSITSTQARILIQMWARARQEWQRTAGRRNLDPSGDVSKLRYWGLVEEYDGKRDDGGAPGWWRVTDQGVQYLQGLISLPKYAKVYNNIPLEFYGPYVDIHHSIRHKFDYSEMMSRRWDE